MYPIKKIFLAILVIVGLCSCMQQSKLSKPVKSDTHSNQSIFIANGLSENTQANLFPKRITRNLITDSKGNIWIASWDGVFKYDGLVFEHVTRNVSSARFFDVFEDMKGHFWLASVGSGVFYYDGEKFRQFTMDDGLVDNRVTHIYEDSLGHMWFGTEGGLSVYDGRDFRNFTEQDGLPINRVNAVIEHHPGHYWIGTFNQAVTYDSALSQFSVLHDEQGNALMNIRDFMRDADGFIWAAGSAGLWRFDNQQTTQYSDQFSAYIYQDHHGNIIFSARQIQSSHWALMQISAASLSLGMVDPEVMVEQPGMSFGMTQDANGNIWYGALDGVYRYDGSQLIHLVDQ